MIYVDLNDGFMIISMDLYTYIIIYIYIILLYITVCGDLCRCMMVCDDI